MSDLLEALRGKHVALTINAVAVPVVLKGKLIDVDDYVVVLEEKSQGRMYIAWPAILHIVEVK